MIYDQFLFQNLDLTLQSMRPGFSGISNLSPGVLWTFVTTQAWWHTQGIYLTLSFQFRKKNGTRGRSSITWYICLGPGRFQRFQTYRELEDEGNIKKPEGESMCEVTASRLDMFRVESWQLATCKTSSLTILLFVNNLWRKTHDWSPQMGHKHHQTICHDLTIFQVDGHCPSRFEGPPYQCHPRIMVVYHPFNQAVFPGEPSWHCGGDP